jgi:hypothetical protein
MCSLCSNICTVNEVSSFDIINIHIIVLGSLLGEPLHHGFHLIHYIIETHTYKHIGRSVSFQYGINIFSFFIHLQITPKIPHWFVINIFSLDRIMLTRIYFAI